MGHSIQDYLKKINSALTLFDCISLLLTMILIVIMALYVRSANASTEPVTYKESEEETESLVLSDSRPFSSIHGTTYTFSWCQGATRTLVKNRVYYENEKEAIAAGKTLSKLCGR